MYRFLFGLLAWLLMQTGKSQQTVSLLPVVENGKWGFINQSGKIKISPSFDQIGNFDGQMATVQKDNLFYLIDSSGTSVFENGYADINVITKEFIGIRNEKFALADMYGKIYSPFSYSFISDNDFYTLSLKTDTTSYDLYNTITHQLLMGKFGRVDVNVKEKYIAVTKEKEVGLLDSLHHSLLNLVPGEKALYENGVSIVKTKEGFQIYTHSGKICGDTLFWKGYRVLSPKFVEVWNSPAHKFILSLSTGKQFPFYQFQTCALFGDSFLLIMNGKKKGLLNVKGDYTLAAEYDNIVQFDDNSIRFFKDKKIGILASDGKPLFSLQFNGADKFNSAGIALALKDSLWGIISNTGKILTPCKYDDIEITSESWKCYKGSSMDLYNLRSSGVVDEVIHFNDVGSVSINKRRQRNYEFTRIEESRNRAPDNSIKSKYGNYKLTVRRYRYPPKMKMKCLIPYNFLNVDYLYGVYSYADKRLIASSKYWDVQINELEDQEYARLTLAGDWQGLISRKGRLILTYPISKNGRTTPSPITYIGPFVNGLARINIGGSFISGSDLIDPGRKMFSGNTLSCKEGKWGYVNGDGEIVMPIELEYASNFLKGKAIVKTKGKYGVIDTLNQFIIKPEYDFISYLENSDNRYYRLIKNKTECGLINDKGRVVIAAQYEDMNARNENRIPIKKNGLWGACDFSGKIIIPFRYDYLSRFQEEKSSFKEQDKWGFIDSVGNVKVEAIYSEVMSFSNGYAAVRDKKGKWGFINGLGEMKIPAVYSRVDSFKEDAAAVYSKKKWWYVDTNGEKISRHWFTKVSEFNQYGLAIVRKKKNFFVLKKENGKLLTHGKYKSIAPYYDGLARVKNKKRKIGFIDTEGKLVIPTVYTGAGDFSEGLVRVRYSNGKWGYIDKKNKPRIAAEYKNTEDFSEGKVTVNSGKNTIIIDSLGVKLFELPTKALGKYKEGLLLINGTYYNQQGKKEMGPYGSATPFKNGVAKVSIFSGKNSGDHLINRKNNSIARYSKLYEVENHLASFSIYNRIGLADSVGNIISVPTFQNISYIGNGIFQVAHFDAIGYIRSDGKWIWKPTR